MSKYVDGFLIPIPKKNLVKYQRFAKIGCRIWMEHGALEYYECVGEDLKTPYGLTFPKMCKLKPNETVIWAFIVYKSKAHRDRVNKKVMADPRMDMSGEPMPFDLKRFAVGGFELMVSAVEKKKK